MQLRKKATGHVTPPAHRQRFQQQSLRLIIAIFLPDNVMVPEAASSRLTVSYRQLIVSTGQLPPSWRLWALCASLLPACRSSFTSSAGKHISSHYCPPPACNSRQARRCARQSARQQASLQ